MDYVNKHFQLAQKEIICLGIIAAQKKVLSTKLSQYLQLNQDDKLKYWLNNLLEHGIAIKRGRGKGTAYLLNPNLFSRAKLNLKPGLKTIEPHKLEALIIEDLKHNGESKMVEIQRRLNEALPDDIRKTVYRLTKKGEIKPLGANKNRSYLFNRE